MRGSFKHLRLHLEKFIVQHIDYLPSVVGRPTSYMSNVQVVFHLDTGCAFRLRRYGAPVTKAMTGRGVNATCARRLAEILGVVRFQ